MINPNKVILDGEQSDAIIAAQAAEIRRLTLTDEERMAVDMAILNCHQAGGVDGVRVAATLRSLLERTK
jgi:16S rRNA G1207 methylase RsmC